MKTCSSCHISKEAAEFYIDKSKKQELSSRCKVCVSFHSQKWAERHPEARQRIMQSWKGRTDQQAYNRKIWMKRAYGISPEDVEQMFVDQEGECAICGKTLKKYHIDHDHTTGAIRGLLCRGCNVGLGFFRDSIGRLASAIQYLEVAR